MAEEPIDSEPTEEQLAREAEAERLARDRMEMQGQAQVELRRWTPELRAQARELAETKHESLEPAVRAALESEHRVPGNSDRDSMRHPLETLAFFGLEPDMTVLEYGPGAGWYTEILAPVLSSQGKLLVTTTDPEGPENERSTFYAERLNLFLTKSPELYGNVEPIVYEPGRPDLKLDGSVDMALVIRGMHGMVTRGELDTWLDEIHAALKPNGIFGVVQHRAGPEQPSPDPKVAAKKGYLPEDWVIEQVEAHGFSLEEKSEVNANPKDTKDHPEGVWTLPPTLRLGEKDRAKYVDIGESDRMTLRFVKVTENGDGGKSAGKK